MQIACIVAARGGSKGLPRKNIRLFAGLPLVCHSIKHANASKFIDKVYLSSEDEEILKIGSSCGAALIKRPSSLAKDETSSEDVLKHSLEEIGECDLVVFLQPTSPLRETEDIDNIIELVLKGGFDSAFSAVEIEDVFIWKDTKTGPRSVNYDFRNRKRRQDLEKQYVENGSIYCFKPEILKKYNNRLGNKIGISLMEGWKVHEIDCLEDFELCEFIYNQRLGNTE